MSEDEIGKIIYIKSRKSFAKETSLKSQYFLNYPPRWKESCRRLLKRYIEIKDLKTLDKRYKNSDLWREILSHHLKVDGKGKAINPTGLSSEDLSNYISGRSLLSDPKFRYVDYFVNSQSIWGDALFQEARKDVIDSLIADRCYSVAKLHRPNIPHTSHEFLSALRSRQFSFYSLLEIYPEDGVDVDWFEKELMKGYLPIGLLTCDLIDPYKYVLIMFAKSADIISGINERKEAFERNVQGFSVEDGLIQGAVFFSGLYVSNERFIAKDTTSQNRMDAHAEITLYLSRGGVPNNSHFASTYTSAVFPYVSFSTGYMFNQEGHELLNITLDKHRLEPSGIANSSSLHHTYPSLFFALLKSSKSKRPISELSEGFFSFRRAYKEGFPQDRFVGEPLLRPDELHKIFSELNSFEDLSILC